MARATNQRKEHAQEVEVVAARPESNVTPGFAGVVYAEVVPSLPRYRAKTEIRFISRAGTACAIRAGNEFTTDELEFDPGKMERIE